MTIAPDPSTPDTQATSPDFPAWEPNSTTEAVLAEVVVLTNTTTSVVPDAVEQAQVDAAEAAAPAPAAPAEPVAPVPAPGV